MRLDVDFIGNVSVREYLTCSKNLYPLLEGEAAVPFREARRAKGRVKGLLSSENVLVDGMLVEASASMNNVQPNAPPPTPSGGDVGSAG